MRYLGAEGRTPNPKVLVLACSPGGQAQFRSIKPSLLPLWSYVVPSATTVPSASAVTAAMGLIVRQIFAM